MSCFSCRGWHVTPRTRLYEGRRFLGVALSFASKVFRTDHIATLRACKGITIMFASSNYSNGEVLMWHRGANGDAVTHYTPEGEDFSKPPFAKSLAYELEEVNQGVTSWTEACFVKFLSAGAGAVGSVIKVAPTIQLLASAGARHRRCSATAKGLVADDVELPRRGVAPRPANGELLDIKRWPPSNKGSNTPNVAITAPSGRPSERIIKRIKHNKNLPPTAPHKIEEIASRKPGNLKSGSHG